jgi:hypothetical protein
MLEVKRIHTAGRPGLLTLPGISLLPRCHSVIAGWSSCTSLPSAQLSYCNKIAEAEAVVSVNEKKCLVMQMHVQLMLDELRGPPNPWLTVT